jgi:hypothetical protein
MVVTSSSSTLNEENQQSQQNNEVEDAHDHDTSSHSVPPQTSTSDSHIVRIHHSTAKDHPVDQIVGDIRVFKFAAIASFCEHFSFLSCIGPNRVDEALLDVD